MGFSAAGVDFAKKSRGYHGNHEISENRSRVPGWHPVDLDSGPFPLPISAIKKLYTAIEGASLPLQDYMDR